MLKNVDTKIFSNVIISGVKIPIEHNITINGGEAYIKEGCGVVIFDSPPLLLSSEAVTLSGFMGQIVLVVEAEKTQQSVVKEALALLDPNQTIGVVLNKNTLDASKGYGYGYGYGGTYGHGMGEGR